MIGSLAAALTVAPSAAHGATTTTGQQAPAQTVVPSADPDEGLRDLGPNARVSPDAREPRSDTAAVLLLAAVGIAAALVVALLAGTRALGREPRWLTALRQSTAEAGWRASGAWSDFRDWLAVRR